MLHIILFILKLIGWILLGVLGLILLILFLLLFSPVQYKGAVKGCRTVESISAHLEVTWLLRLIAGSIEYKDQSVSWKMRAAWKHFSSKENPEKESEMEQKTEQITEEAGHVDAQSHKETTQTVEKTESVETKEVEKDTHPEESVTDRIPEAVSQKIPKKTVSEVPGEKTQKAESHHEKIKEEKKNPFDRIKYTFIHFCDMMKSLMKKKDKLQKFVTYDIHKAAFHKVVGALKRFLHRICPKVLSGKIHYGFEDPALTGEVLAVISMIYPFVGEHLQIWPDFDNQIIEGNIKISGKLRLIHLLVLALTCLTDKNIRLTYRHIRRFKL